MHTWRNHEVKLTWSQPRDSNRFFSLRKLAMNFYFSLDIGKVESKGFVKDTENIKNNLLINKFYVSVLKS